MWKQGPALARRNTIRHYEIEIGRLTVSEVQCCGADPVLGDGSRATKLCQRLVICILGRGNQEQKLGRLALLCCKSAAESACCAGAVPWQQKCR